MMDEDTIPFDPQFEIPALYLKVAAKLTQCQHISLYWWVKEDDGIMGQSEWPIKAEGPQILLYHNPFDVDQELWTFLHECAHVRHHSQFLLAGNSPLLNPHDMEAVKGSNTEEGRKWRELEANQQANRWAAFARAQADQHRGARRTPKDWLKAQLMVLLHELPDNDQVMGHQVLAGEI